eukprot:m.302418 g.302418  ORF g.302418 m.302418 type:complete len:67 (-) comp55237_c0_seq7:148-348(-)
MAKCGRCQKEVYAAEKVNAIGREWHSACLKCTSCNSSLAANHVLENGGQIYCKKCYDANFGPGIKK